MAAVTSVVATVGAAAYNANRQRRAARDAAQQQEEAQEQSAEQLAQASAAAEQDIAQGAERALEELATVDAGAGLQPFAQTGTEAFNQLQNQILSGQGNEGIARLVRSASTDALNRPGVFNLRGPIQDEVARQADLAASAAQPQFRQALLPAAQQGIAAVGDIAGIDARALERQGDIQQAQAAARASALVGANPQLAQLASGAQQARLLGQVGGQRAVTTGLEQIARIAGRNT